MEVLKYIKRLDLLNLLYATLNQNLNLIIVSGDYTEIQHSSQKHASKSIDHHLNRDITNTKAEKRVAT